MRVNSTRDLSKAFCRSATARGLITDDCCCNSACCFCNAAARLSTSSDFFLPNASSCAIAACAVFECCATYARLTVPMRLASAACANADDAGKRRTSASASVNARRERVMQLASAALDEGQPESVLSLLLLARHRLEHGEILRVHRVFG